jgi:glycosyltransferase involved in cell wall biosynthesis
LNHQSWLGYPHPRYGYGAMFKGFMDHVPDDVTLHEHADVMVNMMQPYQIKTFYKNQWRACFTMWESTQLNQRFTDWMNVYDQIIVPCDHNVELFSKHHKNVHKVPLGVDAKIWKPKKRAANPRFRFHAGGSQWLRKGLDIVLEAFIIADLDAELHLKPNPEAHGVADLKLPDNVFMHRQWFNEQETIDYFHQADCYVAATRGEGFGLMPLQAMACGIPTILNDSSGQKEFAHLAPFVLGHKPSPSIYGGDWDETDPKELAEAMREMYANHDTYLGWAKAKLPEVRKWSWESAARQLADTLPAGKMLTSIEPETATLWHHVTLNRTLQCDIADKTYKFTKGIPLRVPEGVLDVVLGAGYVDTYTVEAQ